MQIKVNGKDAAFVSDMTVDELLDAQKVEMKDYVTVQVNDELVDRDAFPTTIIKDGDFVEFLYYMGGGTR